MRKICKTESDDASDEYCACTTGNGTVTYSPAETEGDHEAFACVVVLSRSSEITRLYEIFLFAIGEYISLWKKKEVGALLPAIHTFLLLYISTLAQKMCV